MKEAQEKGVFKSLLKNFVVTLQSYTSSANGEWNIRGFIDVLKNIYPISSDTKIISKILEIHLLPKILEFAEEHRYKVILAKHQNYYPDISFVKVDNEKVRFAVDFKTTYRDPNNSEKCNGFTLGSHGEYFKDHESTKNIQFPYGAYLGHFCLGIIYDRADSSSISETKTYKISELRSINAVVKNFQFFVTEKWCLASDKSGSGNTANIGSINNIADIVNENGMFAKLGEDFFNDYWSNYNQIQIRDKHNKPKKITTLSDFVKFRNGDVSLIVPKK